MAEESLSEFTARLRQEVISRRDEEQKLVEKRSAERVISKLESQEKITPEQAVEFRGATPVFERETLTGFEVTRQKVVEQQAQEKKTIGVLDIGKQVSREATEFERLGVESILEKREAERALMSIEPTIGTTLGELSKGGGKEVIFFEVDQTSGEVGRAVAVKPSVKPVIKEDKIIQPSRIDVSMEKPRSGLSVLTKEFVEGFTLQQRTSEGVKQFETVLTGLTPEGEKLTRFQVGSRELAFTGGLAAAVASEKVGGLGGKLVKKVPVVSKVVDVAGDILSKKPVVTALTGLAVADVAITGVKEGSQEAVRRSFNIVKDVTILGGVLQGAKLGQPTDIALDVSTFQDTVVLRGRGTLRGEPITETTVSTDLGKTSVSQISLGKKTLVINRGLVETNVKVLRSRDLKVLKTFTEPSEPSVLEARLESLVKAKSVDTDVFVETPTLVKTDNTIVDTAKLDVSGKGVSGEISIDSKAITSSLVTKPIRKVDEFSKVFDLSKGVIGLEKTPISREFGEVDIVFDKVVDNVDFLKRSFTDKGFVEEFVKSPEVISEGELFRVGSGEIRIFDKQRPLFLGKKARSILLVEPSLMQQAGVDLVKPSGIQGFDLVSGSSLIKPSSRFIPVSNIDFSGEDVVISSDFERADVSSKGLGSKFVELSSEASILDSKANIKQFVALSQEADLSQEAALNQKAILKSEVALSQDVALSQEAALSQESIISPKSFDKFTIFGVKTPPIVKPRFEIPEPLPSESLFDVFVGKPDNKFFFEEKSVSLSEAISFAKSKVKGGAAASFRVESVSGTDKGFLDKIEASLGDEFRRSKKDEDVFVQKRGFRISSIGEKQDITQKGLEAIRKKDLRSLF